MGLVRKEEQSMSERVSLKQAAAELGMSPQGVREFMNWLETVFYFPGLSKPYRAAMAARSQIGVGCAAVSKCFLI